MASRGINKVILVGNLGNDPEMRYTSSGVAIANISLATSDSWKDKNTGEQQERTEWHRVVFFDRLAEVVGEYLKKGSQVYVEGELRTEKWQDNQGNDRYTTKIRARNMQMLGGRDGGGSGGGGGGAPPAKSKPAKADKPAADQPPADEPPSGDFDDDIPF